MAEARQTTPREWAVAIAGGLALSALLILWLRPAPQPATPPVQITQAPVTTPAPPPPPAPQPAPSTPLILRGILLPGAAIIEDDKSRQRLVRIGRSAAPGWQLTSLTATTATLTSTTGEQRTLALDTTSQATTPAAPPTGSLSATPAALAATSNAYRLALKPHKRDGQTIGFIVQNPAAIPLFRLAGLQAGDVITSLNGQPLASEEKVIELPTEVAGANSLTLEFTRSGRNNTARLQVTR